MQRMMINNIFFLVTLYILGMTITSSNYSVIHILIVLLASNKT